MRIVLVGFGCQGIKLIVSKTTTEGVKNVNTNVRTTNGIGYWISYICKHSHGDRSWYYIFRCVSVH